MKKEIEAVETDKQEEEEEDDDNDSSSLLLSLLLMLLSILALRNTSNASLARLISIGFAFFSSSSSIAL